MFLKKAAAWEDVTETVVYPELLRGSARQWTNISLYIVPDKWTGLGADVYVLSACMHDSCASCIIILFLILIAQSIVGFNLRFLLLFREVKFCNL